MCMILSGTLVGCSKSADPTQNVTVKWENNVISYKGTPMNVSSFSGSKATLEKGGTTYNLMLDQAKDYTSISVNTQSITEENMDKYKDAVYYTEYLGSDYTMARKINDDYIGVVQCIVNGIPTTTLNQEAYSMLTTTPLTDKYVYVDFGDFTFGTGYDEVEVRPDCALISGVVKISKTAPKSECTEDYVITQNNKQYQLKKGSSKKMDYYTYNDFTIQCTQGTSPETYIQFKK